MDLKLEKVGQARNSADIVLEIPEEELCLRYEKLFTAAVNDVLRGMGLIYQTLPNGIMPVTNDMKAAGVAFTIKGSKNLELKDEMQERANMLDAIPAGSVCVYDTSGDEESAHWGEIMTMAAKTRGCRGAIIDGGIRDTAAILKLGFPVFCKYRTSNGMLGRFRMIGYQMPVRIGEVLIRPGDIIFGDADGVIVIPREFACETLLKAEAVRDEETGLRKMVESGSSSSEIVEKGGYF